MIDVIIKFSISLGVILVAGSIAAGIIFGILWLFLCAQSIIQFLAFVIVLFLIFLYSKTNNRK